MIKEYEEVKKDLDCKVSSKYLDTAVVVDDIFTDEYNAFDIRIIGMSDIPTDFFIEFKQYIKIKYNHIIKDLEVITGMHKNSCSILVYLKPEMEIRSTKIDKIKTKMIS